MIRLRKGAPLASPTVIVCRISFHGLGCGEFPISVWLGARGARMQFANFPDRRTTSNTRHGQYLFRGELLGFHASYDATLRPEEMLNIAHLSTLTTRKVSTRKVFFGTHHFFKFRAKVTIFGGPGSEKTLKSVAPGRRGH